MAGSNKRNLELAIRNIVDRIEVIPTSRGFWVNRTDNGFYYDQFVEKGYIGLNIFDIKISEIEKIRNSSQVRDRVNLERAKELMQNHFRNTKENKKAIREELNPSKRTALQQSITLRANQAYGFIFEAKKDDYVLIPSENSEYIKIGKLSTKYIENAGDFPLLRNVDWFPTNYQKSRLDPVLYKAFSSHLAFFSLKEDYRDVVLRTLYDFYFEGNEGNLVLNLGFDGKIPLRNETNFLYQFSEFFESYILQNNLPYNLNDLGTVVNLNSEGKRKLYGLKELTIVAAVFILISCSDKNVNKENLGEDLNLLIDSVENHNKMYPQEHSDFKKSAQDMKLKPTIQIQKLFDAQKDAILNKTDDINKIY